jgi:RNA polymerase sigma factor (sigma-70 family)
MFEDRALIRRFNAGDTQALRRIYEKYRLDLFRVARAILCEPTDVEDVVHDAFVGFAAQAGRFALKGSLKGYLAICVANRARNVGRRNRPVNSDRLAPSASESSQAPDLAEIVASEEQSVLVRSALGQLPYEQRQAIVLHVHGCLRFREIARQTGESVNTVKSRYQYGIRKLRSLLNGQVER